MLPLASITDSHDVVERMIETTRKLVANMAETMYAAPGVGLAATQVDVHERIIVVDISETRDQLKVLINPEIISSSGTSDCEFHFECFHRNRR